MGGGGGELFCVITLFWKSLVYSFSLLGQADPYFEQDGKQETPAVTQSL